MAASAMRDVLQLLAEVDLRRRREAVRALAQVDLVHVELEDLVLGQGLFDLPGQQRFVDLALQGLFAGQEEVARHLLRDGRGALARAAGQVVQRGAHDADVVDAAMLVEAVVLDRQHRLFHDLRDVLDAHQVAPLLAEFADQHVVGGKDPQRNLRPVVGQRIERRQVRIGHRQHEADQQRAAQRQAEQRADQAEADPNGQVNGVARLACTGRIFSRGLEKPCRRRGVEGIVVRTHYSGSKPRQRRCGTTPQRHARIHARSGVLATDLQITWRKLLYTFERLLLRFNVTFDECGLNIGF